MDGTRKRLTAHERFWKKVDRSGGPDACWPWIAGRQRDERGVEWYGVFHPRKGRTVRAHRFALEDHLGRPLVPGMWALHSCDNPPCCNPRHLREGTHGDNVRDKVQRDRQHKGERTPTARITAGVALMIRTRFASGDTLPSLAEEFALSLGATSNIIRGKTWRHVGGPIRTVGARGGRRPQHERNAA